MITFKATIKKFASQGEKTGWTYIDIPSETTSKLRPGTKKSFRVKGMLDDHTYEKLSLVPMGGGNFILALNASIRKCIGKTTGAVVKVKMEVDESAPEAPADFIACLKEEKVAFEAYEALTPSHKHYYTNWISAAKTDATKAKRMAQAINALATGLNFGEMLRKIQRDRKQLLDNGLK